MILDLSPPPWATHLVSDLGDWNKAPLPVSELKSVVLPDDVYFEYAWRDATGQHRADPENHNPRLNRWWPYACNIVGPQYTPDPISSAAKKSTAGRTLRVTIESQLLGHKRRVLVYSPAGCSASKLPYIVFQDGMAYFGWGRAAQVMDLLLAAGEIEPAHLIFVPPVQRTLEYAFNPTYRLFICDEVIPQVMDRAPWNGRATAWGASLGGLLSAQLSWARPEIFQKVVAQSGAFQFSADMDFSWPFAGHEEFLQIVRNHSGSVPFIHWYLECGTLEWLEASNHNLLAELIKRGMPAKLVLRSAGHNWVNWSNGLPAGMLFASST